MLMSDIRKRLVVALGGNAISAPGKVGDIDEQFAQVSETAEVLCDAIERGYHLIVTHGNGPQVGNILRRVELARSELYPIPLEVCVADTQAGMGYMIAQCLSNAMNRRNLTCDVTAVVTTVLVDAERPGVSGSEQSDRSRAHGRPSRNASHKRRLANSRRRQRPLPPRRALAVAAENHRDAGDRKSRSTPGRSSSVAAAAVFRLPSIPTAACAASRPSSTRTAPPACWLAIFKRRRS